MNKFKVTEKNILKLKIETIAHSGDRNNSIAERAIKVDLVGSTFRSCDFIYNFSAGTRLTASKGLVGEFLPSPPKIIRSGMT
ncbi:MAG: hypothetical protein ACJASF_002257 [Vicingaceae bacterium]|jgi:hypothetical protein